MILPAPSNKPIHFVGIGGTGMSALATILLARGRRVSGSDASESATTRRLAAAGATIHVGHAAEHVAGAAAVVLSTAIRADNPEVAEARRLGLPVVHRAQVMAEMMELGESVAVCGTHGKSTTSAMVGLVMLRAGLDPTMILGADLEAIGGNARAGAGRHVVAETDESDGSFLGVFPSHAIVTNIDTDHLDHFGTVENLRDCFARFLGGVDEDGVAVVCADCPGVRSILPVLDNRVITYGLFPRSADVRARNIALCGRGSTLEVEWRGRILGTIELAVPGLHNVSNALAATALLRSLGVEFGTIAWALAEYRGVHRRFEVVGEARGVTIVDDYAHHPAEIQATLGAATAAAAGGRVIATFQPHRYSRTRLLAGEFGAAFQNADTVIVTDVYGAGETPIPGVSGRLVSDSVARTGHPDVRYCPRPEDVRAALRLLAEPGDMVLTLGAGDVWRIGHQLLVDLLAEQVTEPDGIDLGALAALPNSASDAHAQAFGT